MADIVKIMIKDRIINKVISLKVKQRVALKRILLILQKRYEYPATVTTDDMVIYFRGRKLSFDLTLRELIEDYNYTIQERIVIQRKEDKKERLIIKDGKRIETSEISLQECEQATMWCDKSNEEYKDEDDFTQNLIQPMIITDDSYDKKEEKNELNKKLIIKNGKRIEASDFSPEECEMPTIWGDKPDEFGDDFGDDFDQHLTPKLEIPEAGDDYDEEAENLLISGGQEKKLEDDYDIFETNNITHDRISNASTQLPDDLLDEHELESGIQVLAEDDSQNVPEALEIDIDNNESESKKSDVMKTERIQASSFSQKNKPLEAEEKNFDIRKTEKFSPSDLDNNIMPEENIFSDLDDNLKIPNNLNTIPKSPEEDDDSKFYPVSNEKESILDKIPQQKEESNKFQKEIYGFDEDEKDSVDNLPEEKDLKNKKDNFPKEKTLEKKPPKTEKCKIEKALKQKSEEDPKLKEKTNENLPKEKIEKNIIIEYYTKMNLFKTYPINIKFSGKAQKNNTKTLIKVESNFPGCLSVPNKTLVDITSQKASTKLYITPLAKNKVEKGQIKLRYKNEYIKEIPLETKSVQNNSKFLLYLAILLPFICNFLKSINHILGSYIQKIDHLTGITDGLSISIAGFFILLAIISYFINKPSKISSVDDSFVFEK